ncbi:MAG: TylF/MycF/NovP-related O-methyltransferase [Candidatus Taylorbacteria bacterium]
MKKIFRGIKRTINKFAALFGYNMSFSRISNKTIVEKGYEKIFTASSYAPWLLDQSFISIYESAKSNTLVDKYRCYELWQLVKESSKLHGAIIEIGVWRGGTGIIIAKSAIISKITDPVYLCDTFTGVVKASNEDTEYKGGEHDDTSLELVQNLINANGLKNIKILKGIFPEETKELVLGKEFRFCHIDVDVYQSAKDIVNWIWPRLCIGGIIVYDDYGFLGCDGITKFVEESKRLSDRLTIYNINGHAITIKIK